MSNNKIGGSLMLIVGLFIFLVPVYYYLFVESRSITLPFTIGTISLGLLFVGIGIYIFRKK